MVNWETVVGSKSKLIGRWNLRIDWGQESICGSELTHIVTTLNPWSMPIAQKWRGKILAAVCLLGMLIVEKNKSFNGLYYRSWLSNNLKLGQQRSKVPHLEDLIFLQYIQLRSNETAPLLNKYYWNEGIWKENILKVLLDSWTETVSTEKVHMLKRYFWSL